MIIMYFNISSICIKYLFSRYFPPPSHQREKKKPKHLIQIVGDLYWRMCSQIGASANTFDLFPRNHMKTFSYNMKIFRNTLVFVSTYEKVRQLLITFSVNQQFNVCQSSENIQNQSRSKGNNGVSKQTYRLIDNTMNSWCTWHAYSRSRLEFSTFKCRYEEQSPFWASPGCRCGALQRLAQQHQVSFSH